MAQFVEPGHVVPTTEHHARLTHFIKANRSEIIEVWESAVRRLPIARDLTRPLLVDHIPDLLARICEIAEHVGAGGVAESPLDLADLHARDRLEEGFDLGQVVTEYRLLRSCIIRLWARHVVGPEQLTDLQALDEAIDVSIGASVERFTQVRDRTLRALDRIATEAFGSRSLDELLQRLLRVMHETTPAVDTTAILLRDGGVLRVRAAVGLGREQEEGFVVPVGEGFAGAVAASAQPLTLEPHLHSTIKSPLLRSAGLLTLYGVPLVERGEVIGVAHMGSKHASEFSRQDKRLFAALTARATSAIEQHMLHEAALRASKEARERELELRALADNIPQLAWMADATGARFWFNRQWLEFSGATIDELEGWGWQRFQHPDHSDQALATYRRVLDSGAPWEDTYPLRSKYGRYRWFLSRAVPIRDGDGRITRWFGTSTDVTEQRLMGEVTSALTSTLHYDEVLTRVAELVVPDLADWCVVDLITGDGVLRTVVVAHADPSKAAIARQLKESYPPRWNATHGVAEVIRSGQAVLGRNVDDAITTVAQDAEHLRLLRELGLSSYIVAPLQVRDRTLGAITLATSGATRAFRDADLDVANELARRTAIAIDNSLLYREAQDASRLRETVLAIVSHELRTPLSTIDLSAGMLLHGAGETRVRKSAETIRRATERMDRIIGDLLDMAAIQSGRLTVDPEPTSMLELLDEVVDLHEPGASERGIKLVRHFDVADLQLRCDRDRIQQVFSNLIGNAKKFSREGDVITVHAKVQGQHAFFAVSDNGSGISPSELPHIFEPYWSGERDKKKGVGLGLFIASAIVKAHGGSLSVSSNLGEGTTFTFTLPIMAR